MPIDPGRCARLLSEFGARLSVAPAPDRVTAPLEHKRAPYLEALREYADREPGRYHVPGHKGGRAPIPSCSRPAARAPWRWTSR